MKEVNFARCRPFALGLTTVRIVGGHLLQSFICARTVGGKQEDVSSSHDIKGDVISAEQNSVALLRADGGVLCALPGREGETMLCGR